VRSGKRAATLSGDARLQASHAHHRRYPVHCPPYSIDDVIAPCTMPSARAEFSPIFSISAGVPSQFLHLFHSFFLTTSIASGRCPTRFRALGTSDRPASQIQPPGQSPDTATRVRAQWRGGGTGRSVPITARACPPRFNHQHSLQEPLHPGPPTPPGPWTARSDWPHSSGRLPCDPPETGRRRRSTPAERLADWNRHVDGCNHSGSTRS
jgi:hypothetical protein